MREALTGNMSTHVVYCVRAGAAPDRADPTHPEALPVAREMPGEELAKQIGRDGALAMLFDGLRVPVPLPPLAPAILRLIDGQRTVAEIGAAVTARGANPNAFARDWPATFRALERANQLLLAPPA